MIEPEAAGADGEASAEPAAMEQPLDEVPFEEESESQKGKDPAPRDKKIMGKKDKVKPLINSICLYKALNMTPTIHC